MTQLFVSGQEWRDFFSDGSGPTFWITATLQVTARHFVLVGRGPTSELHSVKYHHSITRSIVNPQIKSTSWLVQTQTERTSQSIINWQSLASNLVSCLVTEFGCLANQGQGFCRSLSQRGILDPTLSVQCQLLATLHSCTEFAHSRQLHGPYPML